MVKQCINIKYIDILAFPNFRKIVSLRQGVPLPASNFIFERIAIYIVSALPSRAPTKSAALSE
jgi:hypothetical protein